MMKSKSEPNADDIPMGRFHRLRVLREVDFGVILDGGEYWGDILLPIKAVPEGAKVDDDVEVFIYFDSEDRPIATTIKPLVIVGVFAAMEVKEVNEVRDLSPGGRSRTSLNFLSFTQAKRQLQ